MFCTKLVSLSYIHRQVHNNDPQSLIHDKLAIALENSDLATVDHIPKFNVQTDKLFPQTWWTYKLQNYRR